MPLSWMLKWNIIMDPDLAVTLTLLKSILKIKLIQWIL